MVALEAALGSKGSPLSSGDLEERLESLLPWEPVPEVMKVSRFMLGHESGMTALARVVWMGFE